MPFMRKRGKEKTWKNMIKADRPQITIQYSGEKMWLKNTRTHTHNVLNLLLYHGNRGYAQHYVICTLPALFKFTTV